MKLLVTGVTGKFGTKVVETLLKTIPVDKLAVSVRQGDFDHSESLDAAFDGFNRTLLVSAYGDNETRTRQHANAVAAAEQAGVDFIAYTSLAKAQESTNLFAPTHKATEDAILKTGIPYSVLRNNWYLENEVSSIQGVLEGVPWVTSAGDGHANSVYELSGKPLTQKEIASAFGTVLDKEVTVLQLDDAAYVEAMISKNCLAVQPLRSMRAWRPLTDWTRGEMLIKTMDK